MLARERVRVSAARGGEDTEIYEGRGGQKYM